MAQLKDASDLAPNISSINAHLKGLKSIVNDTLVASTRLTGNTEGGSNEDDQLYNRLLADLTILDDGAVKIQESRLEQECATELAKKSEIGSIEDMNLLCNLLTRQQISK
jgi:hypothetical protein